MSKEEHCEFCWLSVVIIDSARSEQREVLKSYVKEILPAIISFFITQILGFYTCRLVNGQRRFLGV
jgi:hypothetical protein